jgi:hypothetical protein
MIISVRFLILQGMEVSEQTFVKMGLKSVSEATASNTRTFTNIALAHTGHITAS